MTTSLRENVTESPNGNQVYFEIGKRFSSLSELEETRKLYEESHFCKLVKKDVRTLEAAKRNIPKRIAKANASLKYYFLFYVCKFSGNPRNINMKRERKTTSFRQQCPFKIYFRLSDDNNYLEVSRFMEEHNHYTDKELYEQLPEQRPLFTETKTIVKKRIRRKANSKLQQQKIETSTGKKVTLIDFSNIPQNLKANISNNNIEAVVSYLNSIPGSTVEVILDKDKHFKGIFYQDSYMRNMFKNFPEIILVDATYKLLEVQLPIFLLLVIDGDGLSEIVALFICAEETEVVIESTVNIFKKYNTNWTMVGVIMSDKDFVERGTFSTAFPEAKLVICLYHALRSFQRDVTCEKMGITSAERLRCLEIIRNICFSKTGKEYSHNVNILKKTKLKSVVDYYIQNWDNIKEQWVLCFKETYFKLGETTNNRLESTFNKMKSISLKYSTLLQFFNEFFALLGSLRNDRNHHFPMSLSQEDITPFQLNCNEQQFSSYLTPYAFSFIKSQINLSLKPSLKIEKSDNNNYLVVHNENKFIVNEQFCSCNFIKHMGLPCQHMFKLRSFLSLPLFDKSIIKHRWTREFYENTSKALSSFQAPSVATTPQSKRKGDEIDQNTERCKKKKKDTENISDELRNDDDGGEDSDMHFFKSLLPSLKNMSKRNNRKAKMRIQKIIFALEDDDNVV